MLAAAFVPGVQACGGAAPREGGEGAVTVPVLPEKITFAGEAVPLDRFDARESFERELAVSRYMHSRTLSSLRATARYFPVIEPILKKHGIPDDFKYVCMAESGLDPDVTSPARAGGLWQLMPATAREYGLEVGEGVDERYHVEKSTEAACRFLKKAYAKYGSWTMAAASYNLGMQGLDRRSRSQGVTDYYDLFLPEETMRYLFRVLSFKTLLADPARYGFAVERERYFRPYRYEEVQVSGTDIDWPEVARRHGTSYKMLRELNPWIRGYKHANKGGRTYAVKIVAPDFRTAGK